MRTIRFAIAAAVGFLLYQFVVVYIGGFLAAVQIPVAYFRFFGREHAEIGHALLGIALHMLPTILLIAGGILAAERFWPVQLSLAWIPYLLGMLGCVFFWEFVLSPAHIETMGLQSTGTLAVLQSYLSIPWRAAPVAASPLLGLGLAAWLLHRGRRPRLRSVA